MNLHGCAPASLCPPFFLLRGYPGSAKLVPGRPPSSGDSAGPSRNDAVFMARNPPREPGV